MVGLRESACLWIGGLRLASFLLMRVSSPSALVLQMWQLRCALPHLFLPTPNAARGAAVVLVLSHACFGAPHQSFVSELAMHLMEADKNLSATAHLEVEKLITSKVKPTG